MRGREQPAYPPLLQKDFSAGAAWAKTRALLMLSRSTLITARASSSLKKRVTATPSQSTQQFTHRDRDWVMRACRLRTPHCHLLDYRAGVLYDEDILGVQSKHLQQNGSLALPDRLRHFVTCAN